jgi:transposase
VLERYVRQGQKPARAMNRARILLLSNAGMKVNEIAKVLSVSQATRAHVRKQYPQKEHGHILDFLPEAPRSGRPIPLDRSVEAKVSMLACSAPPEGGARWTLHLIADRLVQLDVVETMSHESVSSRLKKTNSNLG